MATVTRTKAKAKAGAKSSVRNIRVRQVGGPVRRLSRVRPVERKTPAIEPGDQKAMDGLLKSISRIDAELSGLQAARGEAVKKLYKLMKTYKLSSLPGHGMVATVFRPKGRATSTIDVYEFSKLVTEEDFMNSVRVLKAEAEKHLSTKELEKITDVVAATLGDETIEVKKADSK